MTLHKLDRSKAEVIAGPVDAAVVISGQPDTTAFVTYDAPQERLCAGEWTASIGKWRVKYDEWEYCLIVSGRCVITGDDGTVITAGPGDAFVLEPGFSGTWEVLEPVRKHWVMRTP